MLGRGSRDVNCPFAQMQVQNIPQKNSLPCATSARVAFENKVDAVVFGHTLAFLTVVAAQGEWQNDSRNERPC